MERLRLSLCAFLAALASPLSAWAETLAPLTPTTDVVLSTQTDRAMRMTVPVSLGPHGPFQFVVDTGADRTVISRELADRLDLPKGEEATLHSMSGVAKVRTVLLPALAVAGGTTRDINAPALNENYLGASGLLGIDSLKGRRITMDFRARTLTIAPPGVKERIEPDMIVVTARSRYGQLVLVDASVDNVPITVIIDTGAENTIGNDALRAMLAKRHRKLEFFPTTLVDVTGGTLSAQVAAVKRITLGGITLDDVVIAFADAHPFKRFGIDKRPAMLLGMDTLRGFSKVSVDFGARKVRFVLPTAG